MSNSNIDYENLGQQLITYCRRYSIPVDYFFEIINDQKVVPMLRGKGMEYNGFVLLQRQLNPSEWVVQKLNLSAQPGIPDQDIGITYRRTGTNLVVETKSAVRGSMKSGERARQHKVPHFNVKCHRSRSNVKLATTTNDRYRADAFDILITNPSNALYAGGTIGEELELIDDLRLLDTLYNHYGASTDQELIEAVSSDWRFVFPPDIADSQGFIPRTPTVYLQNDPHWLPLDQLEEKVTEVVRQRRVTRSRSSHS